MANKLKGHSEARARLTAELAFKHNHLADAEQAQKEYERVMALRFRGLASGHDVLDARVPLMEAWSRYVDARARAGLVNDGFLVVEG